MLATDNKKSFSDWLEFLQRESWQLELIISSILLLIINSVDESAAELLQANQLSKGFTATSFLEIFFPVLLFLQCNLIIHIFFRGLWIASIGLRYISKEINYDALDYSQKFTSYLKRRIIDFDQFIERLERISSIIFSYTFLMIFHFFSFWIFAFILVLLIYLSSFITRTYLKVPIIIFVVTLAFSGALNFIDFIGLGWLKKNALLSKMFYPFYRLYNFFSLSKFYRPLHYNFIDNPLGRKCMYFLVPYILFLSLASEGFSNQKYNFLPAADDNNQWLMENYYDDQRLDAPIESVSIDKTLYSNESMKLFLRYVDGNEIESAINRICPMLESRGKLGFQLKAIQSSKDGFNDGYNDGLNDLKIRKKHLHMDCLSSLFTISIDEKILNDLDYVFYQHPNMNEKGILTYINLSNLHSGLHELKVNIITEFRNDSAVNKQRIIPFFVN